MAIQFEFYKNPQPEKEGEEPSYHPRVVNFQHVIWAKENEYIWMESAISRLHCKLPNPCTRLPLVLTK